MEERLVPLNAVLALLRGDAGWPAPLREQGLACERLELPVTTSEGVVVIDVLAHTEPCQLIVPIEAKGGGNVEDDQAAKYLLATPKDVAAIVTMRGYSDQTVLAPLVVCFEEHDARIRLGLAKAETSRGSAEGDEDMQPDALRRFSVLKISPDRAQLVAPAASPLQSFDVSVPGPPPRIIPFDAESPDDVLSEPLLAAVVAAMSAGKERVAVTDLLAQVIAYWSVYGRATRNRLGRRAAQVLRTFAEGELDRFFDVVSGGGEHDSAIVRVKRSPIAYKPQGQTQGWQAVRRGAHRALRRTPAPQIPGQGTFDALLKEVEASEDE